MSNDDSKLRQLEQQLQHKLYEIVESIKAVIKTDIGNIPPTVAYEEDVTAIFRSFAQKAYMLGLEHATQALKHEGYLTHSDVDAIEQMSYDASQRFWVKVNQGVIVKERQYRALQFTNAGVESHLSNEWVADAIAGSTIFGAYNVAVKTKANKITT